MRLSEGFWSFYDGFNLGRNTVWHLFNDEKSTRENNEKSNTDASQQESVAIDSENDLTSTNHFH